MLVSLCFPAQAQQPTKFDFVINLKSAKQIGLTIPSNVLALDSDTVRSPRRAVYGACVTNVSHRP
jgi:hypothetical protein